MPALHGNYVDLLILIVLLIYIWEGTERGFLALAGEMAAFVISFLLALHLYPLIAQLLIANFTLSRSIANALGFIIAAIALETTIDFALTGLLKKIPKKWYLSVWNRVFGFLPALVNALILLAFILSALLAFPVGGRLKSDVISSRLGGAIVNQTSSLEKTLDQIFGGAAQETLSFLTIDPNSKTSIDLHFKTANYTIDPASESEMLRLVNQERTQRGLSTLALDLKLQEVARNHSKDMFVRGYFAHTDPDGHDPFQRMSAANIHFTVAGENLAYAPNVELAHTGLMNSPGHRANILNPEFHKVGIGVIDGGIYGKMFTQEFTN